MYNERRNQQPQEGRTQSTRKYRPMTSFQFCFFATIGLCILGEVASSEEMKHWAQTGAFMFLVATIFFIGTDSYRMWKVEQTNRPFRKSRW
jgi:hypothetical protein